MPISKYESKSPEGTDPVDSSHVSVYTAEWWINEFRKRLFVPLLIKKFSDDNNMNAIFIDTLSRTRYVVYKNNNEFVVKIKDKNFMKMN
jgi:hypothetical protein